MARQDFLSEFVLRELLAALGAPLDASTADNVQADSFSESLSEDSESQTAPAAANGRQSRVMLVRRTNSAQQRVTLVDRHFDVQAFVPKHVRDFLQQTRGFQTLGRLRGSVVRVTKYHFATLARCLAVDSCSRETSVSLSAGSADKTRVLLYVDALAIVEENDLAADPKPEVESHALVQERLQMLNTSELEKQLMIHQGLSPLQTAESDKFDDERPLLEEDCVIPEEQEEELEEQDGWGLPTTIERPQATDSELIEENGSVLAQESQVERGPASSDELLSTQDSLAFSGNPSVGLSDEGSAKSSMDSHKYPFQQENIQETFVVGSDTENSDTEDEDDGGIGTQKAMPSTQKGHENSDRKDSSAPLSPTTPTSPNTTQKSWMVVDLTGESPEKAAPESLQRPIASQEPKVEATDLLEESTGVEEAAASSVTPQESPKETQTPAKGWGTLLRKLASNLLGTPSGDDSNENFQSPDHENSESDEPATQVFKQPEEEKEFKEDIEDKYPEPEEFMSSQATVMLQYSMDTEENVNAFEYEGMLSDELASPRSQEIENQTESSEAKEVESTSKQTLTQDEMDTITPQKKVILREDDAEFKTPSPSARAGTLGTENKATEAEPQDSVVSTTKSFDSAQGRPSSPNSQVPAQPSEPSATLSPAKSPSGLVISVGSGDNRSGFTGLSIAEPRGSKRRHQQTKSKKQPPTITSTQQVDTVSISRPQVQTITDNHTRQKTKKRRRREIPTAPVPCDGGSQSPQFEQTTAPTKHQRRSHPDRGNAVSGRYTLDAVNQSLGSCARNDQAVESTQERSSRQPRRTWKRYENLIPSLNMTQLRQMMIQDKN